MLLSTQSLLQSCGVLTVPLSLSLHPAWPQAAVIKNGSAGLGLNITNILRERRSALQEVGRHKKNKKRKSSKSVLKCNSKQSSNAKILRSAYKFSAICMHFSCSNFIPTRGGRSISGAFQQIKSYSDLISWRQM